MTRTIKQIKETFKDFSSGLRVIMLVHRNKEGGIGRRIQRTRLAKIVTTNSEEFFDAIEYLQDIMSKDKRTLRIYSAVNSRDIQKSIHKFKQEQLDNDYSNELNREHFYIDIKNSWISCMMKKSCRNQSNFLFDLDECDDHSLVTITKQIEKQTKIILTYQTKNGYHIITEPFNYNKIECLEQVDVHPDGLLLIDY